MNLRLPFGGAFLSPGSTGGTGQQGQFEGSPSRPTLTLPLPNLGPQYPTIPRPWPEFNLTPFLSPGTIGLWIPQPYSRTLP